MFQIKVGEASIFSAMIAISISHANYKLEMKIITPKSHDKFCNPEKQRAKKNGATLYLLQSCIIFSCVINQVEFSDHSMFFIMNFF